MKSQTALLSTPPHSLTFFQLVVLILSVLILGTFVVDGFVEFSEETQRLIQMFDNVVCAILFFDVIQRWYKAESKLGFWKWGWIDLIACIPAVDAFRWGRTFQLIRIIRVLRGIHSFRRILSILFKNRVRSGVGSVTVTSFLLIIFSSVAILQFEQTKDSNIKTAGDALWWSITTITTVGYGDKYPTTHGGRLVAVILMVSGVGLFGTLSGLVASRFVGPTESKDESEYSQILKELKYLRSQLDEKGVRDDLKRESDSKRTDAG